MEYSEITQFVCLHSYSEVIHQVALRSANVVVLMRLSYLVVTIIDPTSQRHREREKERNTHTYSETQTCDRPMLVVSNVSVFK